MTSKAQIQKLTALSILAALVIVLQMVVSIPLGAFTITLTLVPIMLGAILYGPLGGLILGTVFGAVVSFQVVTGAAGVLSTEMFHMAPFITIAVCLLKGAMAGFVAGWISRLFSRTKHKTIGTILSAVSCPLVNTGIFVAALFIFYYALMVGYAAANQFADAFAFIFVGIVGVNFIVEFLINVLLIPVVLRLITIVSRGKF